MTNSKTTRSHNRQSNDKKQFLMPPKNRMSVKTPPFLPPGTLENKESVQSQRMISQKRFHMARGKIGGLLFSSYIQAKRMVENGEDCLQLEGTRTSSKNSAYQTLNQRVGSMRVVDYTAKQILEGSRMQIKHTQQLLNHKEVVFTLPRNLEEGVLMVLPFSIELGGMLEPSFCYKESLNSCQEVEIFSLKNGEFCSKNRIDSKQFLQFEKNLYQKKRVQDSIRSKDMVERKHRLLVKYAPDKINPKEYTTRVSSTSMYTSMINSVDFDVTDLMRPSDFSNLSASVKNTLSKYQESSVPEVQNDYKKMRRFNPFSHCLGFFTSTKPQLEVKVKLTQTKYANTNSIIKFKIELSIDPKIDGLKRNRNKRILRLLESNPFLEILLIQKISIKKSSITNSSTNNIQSTKVRDPSSIEGNSVEFHDVENITRKEIVKGNKMDSKKDNKYNSHSNSDNKGNDISQSSEKIVKYKRIDLRKSLKRKLDSSKMEGVDYRRGIYYVEDFIQLEEDMHLTTSFSSLRIDNEYYLQFYLSNESYTFEKLVYTCPLEFIDLSCQIRGQSLTQDAIRKQKWVDLSRDVKATENSVELPFVKINLRS